MSTEVSLGIAAPMPYWEEAVSHLCRQDPVLKDIVARLPGERMTLRGDPFVALSRAIVGQQLSVRAAQTIWGRLDKVAKSIAPLRISRMRMSTLTGVGLSQRKAEYLRDLAVHFLKGEIVPDRWPLMDDEAVIEELVEVRGIGRWTAEMFLIFNLMRPDILPLDDVGVLTAIARHYNGGVRVTRDQAREIGERWQPWRTVASWYLWRSLDPVPMGS
ncbi:MAG: DNA-3-methyladenine glycosylase 2 family protein [Lautropia sp.]|nr:DNA-3-methyladenine glycosylase 2 family protein [Lautropia sp.]